jgi:hypothetical protein
VKSHLRVVMHPSDEATLAARNVPLRTASVIRKRKGCFLWISGISGLFSGADRGNVPSAQDRNC